MSDLKHDVTAERWAMLIKERRQQVSPFVELPTDICREQVFEPAAAVIRKGNVTIEVTESASAGFIAKVMEALANAW